MRFLKTCLCALFVAAGLFAPKASAEPAIWKVSDADNDVWLFGSVHALYEDTAWRTALMEAALAEAEYYYFEASLSEASQQGVADVVYERGIFTDGRTLSSLLSDEETQLLSDTAIGVGLTLSMLEPMRPWLAYVTISGLAIRASGLEAESGIDYVLQAEIDDAEERYFETPAEQIGFFADMSEEVQVATLIATLRQLNEMPDMIARMIDMWTRGDVDAIDALVNQSMVDASPEVYESLIVARNQIWVGTISDFMDGADDAFITVGAGHLCGEDGVPSLLEAAGFTVERVQ